MIKEVKKYNDNAQKSIIIPIDILNEILINLNIDLKFYKREEDLKECYLFYCKEYPNDKVSLEEYEKKYYRVTCTFSSNSDLSVYQLLRKALEVEVCRYHWLENDGSKLKIQYGKSIYTEKDHKEDYS